MITMDMSTPVTRGELRAEIEQLEIRINEKFAQTRADLEIWGERLMAELARHAKAIQEALSTQISVVDEKYTDLPGRVRRLETKVFGPKRR